MPKAAKIHAAPKVSTVEVVAAATTQTSKRDAYKDAIKYVEVTKTFRCILVDSAGVECGKTSKRFCDAVRHYKGKMHLNIRDFSCDFCGKSFVQKSQLNTHLNTHTQERPYKCSKCDMGFGDPSRRTRHSRSCEGDQEAVDNLGGGNNKGLHSTMNRRLNLPSPSSMVEDVLPGTSTSATFANSIVAGTQHAHNSYHGQVSHRYYGADFSNHEVAVADVHNPNFFQPTDVQQSSLLFPTANPLEFSLAPVVPNEASSDSLSGLQDIEFSPATIPLWEHAADVVWPLSDVTTVSPLWRTTSGSQHRP